MGEKINQTINRVCAELFNIKAKAELTVPEEKFGDFSTNVALQLSKQLGVPPREIAEKIKKGLDKEKDFAEINVAGPGFINLRLKDEVLFDSLAGSQEVEKSLAGQGIVAEYSDPNPFKVLHAGHLYTSVVGDGISNILEAAGAKVHRVNYGGDVGLHVAKAVWAVLKNIGGENPAGLENIAKDNRADWLAGCYVEGNKAYDQDEKAKKQIAQINVRLYAVATQGDKDSPLGKIYWQTRQWSYDYFEEFYSRIGISFEKYYPESKVAELGLDTVKKHTPKIYSESDGAIVYKGEREGLHTRVFVTREGLPTYEAKEVGLIFQKQQDYGFDRSIVITANEISQYMQVVLVSIGKFAPDLVDKTTHLTHGIVKLPGAEKMSSRKGNFLKAADILNYAEESSKKLNPSTTPAIVLGAVKYSFLKSGLGGDIMFDPKESVSLEGNSGPYLQYALVRAKSILQKAGSASNSSVKADQLNPTERSLARKITNYPEVFATALDGLAPHHICTYLYELSQVFNRFYETNRVIDDERAGVRLELVKTYAGVLQSGLDILGIEIPEKM